MFEAVSLLISLVAVAISLATLVQNRNMVEESTRPYIVFRTITTFFKDPKIVFMIKNYGETAAIISSLTTEPHLSTYQVRDKAIPPFNRIIGSLLAPGQSQICHINKDAIEKNPVLNVTISYKTKFREYSDTFEINLAGEFDNYLTRSTKPGNELEIISYTLQDYVEKHL